MRIGAVAVDVSLPEIAKVGDGLIGPGVARLPACAGGEKGELVVRRLRHRVDAGPVLAQYLHRRRGRRAESVIGAGKGDVEFGVVVAARAEIGIDAAQL